MRGYRGFLRELSRTGTARAFLLQARTGVAHIVARARRQPGPDPVRVFLEYYAGDGVRLPEAEGDRLRLDAQRCVACGLCTLECARVGGAPPLDPMDAVAAAARLAIDVVRLALPVDEPRPCAACGACDLVCPTQVPIRRVQLDLAARAAAARVPAPVMAEVPRIG
jgi:ferredoxin